MIKCEDCNEGQYELVDMYGKHMTYKDCLVCRGTGFLVFPFESQEEPDLDPYPERLWPEVEMN